MIKPLARYLSKYLILRRYFKSSDRRRVISAMNGLVERVKLNDHPDIFLRPNTKDLETFEEVFIDRIYDTHVYIQVDNIIDGGGNTGLASRFFKLKYPNANIAFVEIDDSYRCKWEYKLKLAQIPCISDSQICP